MRALGMGRKSTAKIIAGGSITAVGMGMQAMDNRKGR
jgi:hypothetical protein